MTTEGTTTTTAADWAGLLRELAGELALSRDEPTKRLKYLIPRLRWVVGEYLYQPVASHTGRWREGRRCRGGARQFRMVGNPWTIRHPQAEADRIVSDLYEVERLLFRLATGKIGHLKAAERADELAARLGGDDVATEPATGQAETTEPAQPARAADRPELRPCIIKALQAHERAITVNPELRSCRDVFNWLKDNDPDKDYVLPPSARTFATYVSEGRKAQQGVRNSARGGRPHGPSIVDATVLNRNSTV